MCESLITFCPEEKDCLNAVGCVGSLRVGAVLFSCHALVGVWTSDYFTLGGRQRCARTLLGRPALLEFPVIRVENAEVNLLVSPRVCVVLFYLGCQCCARGLCERLSWHM